MVVLGDSCGGGQIAQEADQGLGGFALGGPLLQIGMRKTLPTRGVEELLELGTKDSLFAREQGFGAV